MLNAEVASFHRDIRAIMRQLRPRYRTDRDFHRSRTRGISWLSEWQTAAAWVWANSSMRSWTWASSAVSKSLNGSWLSFTALETVQSHSSLTKAD